ncbi:NUDIX domain-containing protein [bacterium]|nr:NUDIX domain-containing protein [bacterium]MBU1958644.1 NUDIX domain-containing protein [bacterium]
MLHAKEDLYNGLIVEPSSIHESSEAFKIKLHMLIKEAHKQEKNLIWIDLERQQAQHIAMALESGFEFHNCEPHRVTLTYSVKADAYIPVAPTHTVGVGAVVINNANELLMVRDRIHTSNSLYKLPGGMLEHGDKLSDGVEREVWEETGIESKLIKMVSLLNAHPHRFNKSNMYIVFHLEALSTKINVIDTHEIEEAIWMPLDEFFSHEEMSKFQKDLVRITLESVGLSREEYQSLVRNQKHVEVYG